ncbi:hypothetical protein Tco_0176668, partial [Tanacetum coccineum]
DVVFDGTFGGVGDEEVVVGEGVVVTSSSLDKLTNSFLGGIMVSLIFLEGLDEEALVEFVTPSNLSTQRNVEYSRALHYWVNSTRYENDH